MGPEQQRDGAWLYPPIGAELETMEIDDIGVYISIRQNMFAQYIETRHIMDLFLVEEQRLLIRLLRRRREHPDLDILRI